MAVCLSLNKLGQAEKGKMNIRGQRDRGETEITIYNDTGQSALHNLKNYETDMLLRNLELVRDSTIVMPVMPHLGVVKVVRKGGFTLGIDHFCWLIDGTSNRATWNIKIVSMKKVLT